MLEVVYHCAKFGEARISPAVERGQNVEFLSVCLSVCLPVTLFYDFAMKLLEYINGFDTVG